MTKSEGMPRGPRDTRNWYRGAQPLTVVDPALVDFVSERGGPKLLDLGCGLGGYSRALADRGFDHYALDVNDEYIDAARSIGVRADRYDGERIPLDDGAVDTVFMLEVLEHLEDPAVVLREARRVAKKNVLVSTPNCTQRFPPATVEFSHMLDLDHRQFFTVDSLRALLASCFERSRVMQSHPLDEPLANLLLPRGMGRLYRGMARVGVARPRFFSRLLGEGWGMQL
jgi:SAM-dependent methyltransferase